MAGLQNHRGLQIDTDDRRVLASLEHRQLLERALRAVRERPERDVAIVVNGDEPLTSTAFVHCCGSDSGWLSVTGDSIVVLSAVGRILAGARDEWLH